MTSYDLDVMYRVQHVSTCSLSMYMKKWIRAPNTQIQPVSMLSMLSYRFRRPLPQFVFLAIIPTYARGWSSNTQAEPLGIVLLLHLENINVMYTLKAYIKSNRTTTPVRVSRALCITHLLLLHASYGLGYLYWWSVHLSCLTLFWPG